MTVLNYDCHQVIGMILFLYQIDVQILCDRITVVIDTAKVRKLRNIQAKMIATSPKSISFSRVLNLVVSEGLKKYKA